MPAIRPFLYPLWLAAARLQRRTGRVALVGVGIATSASLLAAVLGGSLTAQDRAVAATLRSIPPSDRAVRAAWFGIPGSAEFERTLDPLALRTLRTLGPAKPTRAMLYRQTRIEGNLVDLGAVDGLRRWVRLRSGRLPRPCRPGRCEVVQVGGSGGIPNVAGLRLVRVGRGWLTSRLPLGRTAPPGAYGSVVETARFFPSQTTPPFLLAENVASLAPSAALESIFRSYAWVLPLDPGSVHPWQIESFASRVTRARSALQARSFRFDLTAPTDELEVAQTSGRVAGRRLLLLGGQAAAFVLAFALLAAGSMRRNVTAARRRLGWFGARRWQLWLAGTAEAGAVALMAVLLGWLGGAALSAGLAQRAGSAAGAIVLHSVASGSGLVVAAAVSVVAALVLLLALTARPIRVAGLSLGALDIAAVGALTAVVIGLARGEADAQALARERGTAAFLVVLPGLIAFVAAIAVARALPPSLRLLQLLLRRAPFPARLAAVSLARAPGRAAIAAGFLVVSLGLAVFADAYRSTLSRGLADQAAFAVPLDFTLREDLTKLVRPIDAAPLPRYRALARGVRALPVIRLSGGVSRFGDNRGLTLLGVPADALPKLSGWRSDFAVRSPAELARQIERRGPALLRGPRLPADARAVELPVVVRGGDLALTLDLETPRGDFVHIALGETRGPGTRVLRGPVPQRARGGRVTGMSLEPTALSRETGEPLAGTLSLGRLRTQRAGGAATVISRYSDWIGLNGISVVRRAAKTRLRYLVTQQLESRFRPRQPTDGRPIPALVSGPLAAAAGPGGVLPLQLNGPELNVRIVGTARLFPSTDRDFVVSDEHLLATALNADSPGAGLVNEVWVGVRSDAQAPGVEAALRRPPFDVLQLTSRRTFERELRTDPLARAVLLTLAAAAAVALALALAGLLLVVASDLADERGDLFDLEAEGAAPTTLRLHVALRALALTAVGLIGGVATGGVLAATVVDLVALTANAALPEPPLLLEVDWITLSLGLLVYLTLAVALVAALTGRVFRPATAGRPVGAEP